MANQGLASPYTPGFGRRPPVVAGRDALLDDVARVLEAPAWPWSSLRSGALGRPSSWLAQQLALLGTRTCPGAAGRAPSGPETSGADAAGSWPVAPWQFRSALRFASCAPL